MMRWLGRSLRFCGALRAVLVGLAVVLGSHRVLAAHGAMPAPEGQGALTAPLPESVPEDFELGSSIPTQARRALEQRSFAARPVTLELRGGVGTVVGLVGVTVSFDPWSRLALGVGLGANTSGFQLAGFVRVRPLVFLQRRHERLHALGLEVGYSTGPFRDFSLGLADGQSPNGSYSWDRVHWIQPQITYETRSYRGFNLLVGVGAAIPIAERGYRCLDVSLCSPSHISAQPTVTVGVGWALGL